MKAIRLRTADLYEPMGIDLQHPLLSWNLEGEGKYQIAYEIQAAHTIQELEDGEFIWKTGKTDSNKMTNLPYEPSLCSREHVCWRVRVWNEKHQVSDWSEPAHFEMGLLEKKDWAAKWIAGDYIPEKGVRYPVDEFQKEFSLQGQVVSARLYLTACGVYEAKLNGKRVGEQILTPGSTTYEKRMHYQTYDVTNLLASGENVWTISLGDGWFRGKGGAFGASAIFGDTTCVFGQLEITYQDGTKEQIVTDETFQWSNDGIIRFNDMKDGETIDFCKKLSFAGKARCVDWKTTLCCSNNVPVTEHEHFRPEVLQTPDGSQVLDFKQNLAGYVAFCVKGPKGHHASMQMGEMLDDEGNFTVKNLITEDTSSPYIPDYCDDSRFQTIDMVLSGENDEYKPRFSVQGFRYVKLTDWPEKVIPENFEAIAVYSDLEVLSEFHSSNKQLEKLVENTLWSMKGNFLDVPTDCPTRERSPWLGDAQLFFDTGCYFMDLSAFFRKWIQDIFDDQAENGMVYNIVPRCETHGGMNGYVEGSSGWTDAGILLPYRHFLQYGDRTTIENVYSGMQRLIQFLCSRMGDTSDPELDQKLPDSLYRKYIVTTGFHFGEWNEPDSSPMTVMEPKYEVATAYLAYSLSCFAKMAEWLGKEEEAKENRSLAEKVKEAYRYYFVKDGKIKSERMCELVRPAALNLIEGETRHQAIADLAELVKKKDYHIGTGFLSTPFVLPILSEGGYDEEAFKMLENRTYPSWLYEVEQGATTIWENWDGIASRNHYSNGAVCSWLFEHVCGIRVEGENHFRIAPVAGGETEALEYTFRSKYGKISCGWKKVNGQVQYQIEIPVGCTAEICLSGQEKGLYSAGRYEFFPAIPYLCNPYLPGKEHVPDGEPHIFGKRLYVFGSHDEIGTDQYCTGSYVGWSAPLEDLTAWKFEGEIYAKGEDPLDPNGDKIYYAPDVVQGNDGRYYLYYSICDSYILSAARAEKPEGPYHFYGHVKDQKGHVLGSAEGDDYQFDPAVINDEGRIYLYSGQGMPVEEVNGRKVKGAMVCELEDDMLTVKGQQQTITSRKENCFEENPFFEASSIRKIKGKYYFIYSPLPNTHNLCYAISDYPDRDFVYQGVLVSNADIFEDDANRQIPMNYWGNNHGSILELKGEYYIFYHRNTNHSPFARQGCLERIERLENGKFRQAELTSLGFAKEPRKAKGCHAAYTACLLQRKDMPAFLPYTFFEYTDADPWLGEDETPIPYVANLTDGAMAGYRYFDFSGSEQTITLTARCCDGGEIEILCNGKSCGSVELSESEDWKKFSARVNFPTGKAELRMVYHGSGKADILYLEME